MQAVTSYHMNTILWSPGVFIINGHINHFDDWVQAKLHLHHNHNSIQTLTQRYTNADTQTEKYKHNYRQIDTHTHTHKTQWVMPTIKWYSHNIELPCPWLHPCPIQGDGGKKKNKENTQCTTAYHQQQNIDLQCLLFMAAQSCFIWTLQENQSPVRRLYGTGPTHVWRGSPPALHNDMPVKPPVISGEKRTAFWDRLI